MDFKISKQNEEVNISVLLKYITIFPQLSDHQFHYQGQAAGLIEPLDDMVRTYKKACAWWGSEEDRHYRELMSMSAMNYLMVSLFPVACREGSNQDGVTIRNIIASVKYETRHSKFDQENVMELKKKWEVDANIKFIPKGSIQKLGDIIDRLHDAQDWDEVDDTSLDMDIEIGNKLCFVYQPTNMQRLYRKYGPHLVLLDATHKVCKYSLSLFFLVVQTNVNFQIAAIIVLADETSKLLTKALHIIKEWNPDVTPKYAMVDFDSGEILSLETVYPSILIFLCDFHREQSWHRWVNKRNSHVFMIADDVKKRLRRIANSRTVEECKKAVHDFRSWEFFRGQLVNYFNKTWYPELER